MFGYFGPQAEKTEREQYLEDELQRHREAEERAYEERERQREERAQARKEERYYEERQADNWPEALQKQANLCWREYNGLAAECPELVEEDDYFKLLATGCERALEIWHEVEPTKRVEIEALEKQIEALRDSVREEVAAKLETENAKWGNVSQALREEEINRWLWW